MKTDDGLLLQRMRRTLGLSQERFAAALGVARQTISDNERGATTVPRERLMAALLLALVRLDQARRAEARLRRPFG